jgi:hypothetical protein
MTTTEIKQKLIEKIESCQDEEVLREAMRILHIEEESRGVYHLSPEQKSAVAEAREDIKKGDYLSDKEANKEIDSLVE